MLRIRTPIALIVALVHTLLLTSPDSLADDQIAKQELAVPVHDEELSISRYPAQGKDLLIFLRSGGGSASRVHDLAQGLAVLGVETWTVDLAESLFLTGGVSTLREMDGRYVAGLVNAAHEMTAKSVTLMAYGYNGLPLLRGIRVLQEQSNSTDELTRRVNGAVLISPELYSTIPDLGLDPVYDPIADTTNAPIILYQAGKAGNRWQLPTLMEHLQSGGAEVYTSIMPGVTGLFYDEDTTNETLKTLAKLPHSVAGAITNLRTLELTSTPVSSKTVETQPGDLLDTSLIPYRGDPVPPSLDLNDVNGARHVHNDYRGKVTVVNFWASWCGPCVEEIPSLNRLRQLMADKPFELVSIDYAEEREQILAFLAEVDVDFPVLLDTDGKVSADWNVLVFPSTFVIGPDGLITYGVKGGIHWDAPETVGSLEALMPGQ